LVPGCKSPVLPAGKDDPDENFRAGYDISLTTQSLHWKPKYSLQNGITEIVETLRLAI